MSSISAEERWLKNVIGGSKTLEGNTEKDFLQENFMLEISKCGCHYCCWVEWKVIFVCLLKIFISHFSPISWTQFVDWRVKLYEGYGINCFHVRLKSHAHLEVSQPYCVQWDLLPSEYVVIVDVLQVKSFNLCEL